jgi:hypothetical protein
MNYIPATMEQQKPIVHSRNPVGRARMENLIDRYFDEKHE